jgi:RNA polymerase sigma-70 factor (ECF subfamily)
LALTQSQPINYELHDPDVRLMLQVRGGDAGAFEELVLRYQNRLLTVLEHLVGSFDCARVHDSHTNRRCSRAYRRCAAIDQD